LNTQFRSGLLDRQVEGLLAQIARYREQRCGEFKSEAHGAARALLRAARHDARMSVHRAILEARASLEEEARRAGARAELEARRGLHHRTQLLLGRMWREISGVLERRWRNPAHRALWIGAAIREAAGLIGARDGWCIEHGPDWSSEARRQLEGQARRNGPSLRIEWVCDDRIVAGLRIRAAGVCLDASVAGLIARREQIESDYLAQCLGAADTAARPQALLEHSGHE
jgi:vacuolar-type H+-ATPase subunit H